MNPHRGILISRIPVDGFAGLVFTVGMTTTLLVAMPALRPVLAASLLGALLLAPILNRIRNH
jgi:hypothetical protein